MSQWWVSYSLFLIMYPSLINFLFPHTTSSTLTENNKGTTGAFRRSAISKSLQSNFLEPAISEEAAVLCVCRCAI